MTATKTPTFDQIDLGNPNDGLIEFFLGGAMVKVDVFLAYERIFAQQRRYDEGEISEEEFVSELVKIMVGFGFPTVPHYTAVAFNNRISERFSELQKKIAPAPANESSIASCDSTASTVADGTPKASGEPTG